MYVWKCSCIFSWSYAPVNLQGSSTELRELAAEGLGDLVRLTSTDVLKPFVVQITGKAYWRSIAGFTGYFLMQFWL